MKHYAYERPYRFAVRLYINNRANKILYITKNIRDAIQTAKLYSNLIVAVIDRETGKRQWDNGLRYSGYHGDRLSK